MILLRLFSNALLWIKQEEGEKTPLKGTIGVSNPWEWTTATEYIENHDWTVKYLYGPVLADALLTVFRNNIYAFQDDPRVDIPDINSKRYVTIRWFDDRVTAKLNRCVVAAFRLSWSTAY